jgi:hypothetical protein
MPSTNDLDLLRKFIRDHSQDAFTALVRRHLNLVYCAALRQVRSRQLAEEVAQSVFSDLARHAARLKPGPFLKVWIFWSQKKSSLGSDLAPALWVEFSPASATLTNKGNSKQITWNS